MEREDIQKLAIGAAIAKTKVDALKKVLEPSSSTPIDMLVHIQGDLTKAANKSGPIPAALPKIEMVVDALDVMAELVSGMNEQTRETFLERLGNRQPRDGVDAERKAAIEEDVAKAFMKRFVNGNRQDMDEDRKAKFDAVWKVVAGTTTRTSNGSVKFKGAVEVVEDHNE